MQRSGDHGLGFKKQTPPSYGVFSYSKMWKVEGNGKTLWVAALIFSRTTKPTRRRVFWGKKTA